MARKNRRAYLNDYQKGMNGDYYYSGRYMAFDGSAEERRKLNIISLGLSLILVILFIVSGVLNDKGLWNTFYVLIPFAAEAVCLALMIYRIFRLYRNAEPLKEYIYKQTVPGIQGLSMAAAICAAVEIIACVVFMIINKDFVVLTVVVFLAAKVISAGLLVVYNRYLKSFRWVLQ